MIRPLVLATGLLVAAALTSACGRQRPPSDAPAAAPAAHATQRGASELPAEGAPDRERPRPERPAGPPTVRLLGGLTRPADLATDGRAVYVADQRDGGRVVRLDLRTGAVDVLAVDEPGVTRLAVDDDKLYWVRQDGEAALIRAIDRPLRPEPGGPATLTQLDGRVVGLDATGAQLVVTVAAEGQAPWLRVAKTGGAATPLGGPRGGVAGAAVALGEHAWGVHQAEAGGPATLWELSLAGGGAHALATGAWRAEGSAVAADPTHVYVLHSNGVDEVPRAGGAPRTLATGRVPGGRLAHDSASLFLAIAGGDEAPYAARVPKGGGGTAALTAPGPGTAAVAARDGMVFWLTGGEDGGVWTSPRTFAITAEGEPLTPPEPGEGEAAAGGPHDP